MCNIACVQFGAKAMTSNDVQGKSVLEIGAMDVNGSLRPVFEAWGPAEYIGIDVAPGPGVDRVCRAEHVVDEFGPDRFDLVLATEVIEHVQDWRTVISNIKNVCKPGGVMLVTTPSPGFPYHPFPHDFWRYNGEDMKRIFADCLIERLEDDGRVTEVFVKVRKPENFREVDLSDHELYSVVEGRRIRELNEEILQKERRKHFWFEKVNLRVINLTGTVARRILRAQ